QCVPLRCVEFLEPAAGVFETFHGFIVYPAAANRIDDELNAHATPCGVFERLRELLGNVARFEDVGLETDPAFGSPNSIQHCGEYLVTVGEHAVAIASCQVDAEKPGEVIG